MKQVYLVMLVALLASACASQPPISDKSEKSVKATPKVSPAQTKQESLKKEAEKAAVVGRPVAGSKFARLELGMSPQEVEQLIGKPSRQLQQTKGKASRRADKQNKSIRYSYRNEGVLTFTEGTEGLMLTRILVNLVE